jgi:hypothetical protein
MVVGVQITFSKWADLKPIRLDHLLSFKPGGSITIRYFEVSVKKFEAAMLGGKDDMQDANALYSTL